MNYPKFVTVLLIAFLTGGLHLIDKFGVNHAAWGPWLAVITVALSGMLGALKSFLVDAPPTVVPLPPLPPSPSDPTIVSPLEPPPAPDTKKEGV